MSVAIEVEGLWKGYRDGAKEVEVLRGASFHVEAGEMVAVVGPSGSGKSTLLQLLGALDVPDQGSLRLDGLDPAALSPDERAAFRNRTVGFVFQFHQLLPDFNALENIMLPGRIAGKPAAELAARATDLLNEVGLAERWDHFPNQLSGGERQRVALCRALVLEPPLLLADEPTGNLDPESGERVFELMVRLQERHGTTAVLVTHNPEIARRCVKLWRLENGVLSL